MHTASVFILLLTLTGCDRRDTVIPTPTNGCVCTEQYDPVCGADGKTYGNPCQAACAGITNYVKGKCQ